MNHFHRVFLPLAALVIFAGSLSAADTLELKQRWIAGKKYYQTMQTVQTSSFSMAGQTLEQAVSTTMEITQAVRLQPDGKSKRMTMKYDRVAMDMSMNGQKVSFDSSKPDAGNDPLGFSKTFGSIAGKELQILLSENDEITGLENYDEFIKMLGSSPVPGMDMSKMFSKESITQMMKGQSLQSLPGHPVKPGDSWPFTTNLELAQMGKVAIAGNYVLKGMGDYKGIPVAEILADAKVSMDFSGGDPSQPGAAQLAQLGMKVEGGTLKGTIHFDPKLGIARNTQMTQDMTMTMKNPTDPSATISVPLKQTVEMTLIKVEDLK
jgi:hypothetical protein